MADIINLTEQSFKDTTTGSSIPVLVDFWAPWCGPCKAIAPILQELATELDGKVQICKVNVDDSSAISAEFNIRAIPTLLLFKDGKVAEQFVGMVGKDDLKAKLEAHA
tara:strand:- start:87 stop:410 length:324 start_codon:yes stop_codon:yes gene_type:complete